MGQNEWNGHITKWRECIFFSFSSIDNSYVSSVIASETKLILNIKLENIFKFNLH